MKVTLLDFYKGRTVIVTGATGLIGSWMVNELANRGAKVVAYYHKRQPNRFTKLADSVSKLDLLNYHDVVDSISSTTDIVINCAGITGGVGMEDKVSFVGPATAIEANVIHACFKKKVDRHAFLSSTTVYPLSEKPLYEEDSFDLVGKQPYPQYAGIGWSKRYLEQLCKYYFDTVGLKCAIIRPTGAYGRYDTFGPSAHVIPAMIERAIARVKNNSPFFEVWGDGNDIREYPHAATVAQFTLHALEKQPFAIPFNLGTGQPITTLELGFKVTRAVDENKTWSISTVPTNPSAIPIRIVSMERAKRLLGWISALNAGFNWGLSDTIEWYRRGMK